MSSIIFIIISGVISLLGIIYLMQSGNYSEEKYKSGNLKKRIYFGKKSKLEVSYYENGNIENIIRFKNNKFDGNYKHYYPNGQLCEKGFYKKDKLNGEFYSYYENGQLSEKKFYINGKAQGEALSFSECGEYCEKLNYKNDDYDGVFKEYYKGSFFGEKIYKKGLLYVENEKYTGKLINKYFYGELRSIENYKNGLRDGEYTFFYKNGTKAIFINFKKGKPKFIETFNEEGELENLIKPTWNIGSILLGLLSLSYIFYILFSFIRKY